MFFPIKRAVVFIFILLASCDRTQQNLLNNKPQQVKHYKAFLESYEKNLNAKIQEVKNWLNQKPKNLNQQMVLQWVQLTGALSGYLHPRILEYFPDFLPVKNVNVCELGKDLGYFAQHHLLRSNYQKGIAVWDALLTPVNLDSCDLSDPLIGFWHKLLPNDKIRLQQSYAIRLWEEILLILDSNHFHQSVKSVLSQSEKFAFRKTILQFFQIPYEVFKKQWHKGFFISSSCMKATSECGFADPLLNSSSMWIWQNAYWRSIQEFTLQLIPVWQADGLQEFLAEKPSFLEEFLWPHGWDQTPWSQILEIARSLGPQWCKRLPISDNPLPNICESHDRLEDWMEWIEEKLPIAWSLSNTKPGHGDND